MLLKLPVGDRGGGAFPHPLQLKNFFRKGVICLSKKKTSKKDSKQRDYDTISSNAKKSVVMIKNQTKSYMNSLGTHKEEFDDLITIYSQTLYLYYQTLATFKKEKFKFEVSTESGGTKKSGTASALEVLRKDIGTYSDRLGLNPKSIENISKEKTIDDPLEKAMLELQEKLK